MFNKNDSDVLSAFVAGGLLLLLLAALTNQKKPLLLPFVSITPYPP